MTSKEALKYFVVLCTLSFDKKGAKNISIIKRDLEVLEILKKWVVVKETGDDLFPYDISVRRGYVSSGSVLELSKEEYELLKEWLKK